jgi:hypothetical protein
MTSNIQAAFGSGSLFAIPSGANPTPVPFGIIQDTTFDFSYELKTLHGQLQWAVKSARGKGKATWKCKSAQLNGAVINQIFFNGSLAASSQDLTALAEVHTVPGVAGTPTPNVTVTYASTFLGNISVDYAAGGAYLVPVTAGSEATGFYSVTTAGVYTFGGTDVATAMHFTYLYEATETNEAHTVPAPAGPYTVTVTQAATFVSNVTVKYAATLNPLICVASGSEAAGKYSFAPATGIYTFAAADASVDMLFTYTRTTTATAEAHTVPNPVSQTVTATYNATWANDLGVKYALTGIQLGCVAGGAEATGFYSVAAGVYTFAAGDSAAVVALTYSYTAATGNKITITNNLMGDAPYFEMVFDIIFEGNNAQLHMVKAVANKWTFGSKLDDFTIPDWEGEFMCNDAGILGYISFTR